MTADVRWGFLGAGRIATEALAPAVHAASGATLQAAAARDPARATALEPAGAAYADYRAVLDDGDVDVVYVALANDAHAPWTVAALEAGKHVLCEKPLALDAAEVRAMADAARAAGRLLVEASWYRWHPRTRAAEALVAAGELGPVRRVRASFAFDGELAGNYRLDPARGGGALYDVGCYAVSAAQWAFAPQPASAVRATAEVGPTGVDLVTRAEVEFPGGTAELLAGIAGTPAQEVVVTGAAATLELRDAPFTSWRDDATALVVRSRGGSSRRDFPPTDAYRVMVEHVSRAVRGEDDAYLVPLAESLATAAILDACFASARAHGATTPVARA